MSGKKVTINDVLERLEGVVNEMNNGFSKNQVSLESLSTKVSDLSDSVEMAHNMVRDLQSELKLERKEKLDLAKDMTKVNSENTRLKVEVNRLKEKVIDFENRNRRNCLELDGITQDTGETNELLEGKLLTFFKNKLNIDIDQNEIERCHRVGPNIPGKSRPIIVRFLNYKLRQKVWNNKRMLKGSKIYINESFAYEVKERRRILWPYLKNAWKVPVKAFLSVDKLIIDGKVYTYDKVDKIPECYKPAHTRTVSDTVLFFTKQSPFSNFYKRNFTISDVTYSSVEQYYSFHAAKFSGDLDRSKLIMQQTEPAEHRKTVKEIRKLTYIRYRNKLTNIIRKAETNYYSNLLLNEKFSIQNLWKVYRHLMGKDENKKATVLNKLINDNGVVTGNDGIANTFNKYFCTIGQKLAETFQVNDNYKKYLTSFFSNSMFLNPITEFELHKEITKLPTDKSPGYDEIPPKIVKKSALFILKPLTHIYNLSFLQGYVPDKLKLAKVVPIHKKNDIYHPGNYRPISLLSVFNKLLEKLMFYRIYSFLEKFNILFEHQFGFRQKYSTVLALIEITDNIKENLDNGNCVIGTYLDLTKAFDTVNHQILLKKLDYYGIRGVPNTWFKSYLNQRKQVTYVNNTYSNICNITTGVPQGSVLGPLLFLIYVNDIATCVKNCKLRLFADDTNLFVSGKKLLDALQLSQDNLNILSKWFNDNQLTLNIDKTCYSIFSNKRNNKNINTKLYINNQTLGQVKSVKYLGVFLDQELNWESHVNFICSKIMKLAGAFHYISQFINNDSVLNIYYAYIFPHIKYGIEIYGACPAYVMNLLQATQTRLLKILFKIKPRESATEMFLKYKLLTCRQIYQLYTSLFVYKQQNRLLPVTFNEFYVRNSSKVQRCTRQSNDIYINKYKTAQGQKTIKYIGGKLWNEIPEAIKLLPCFSLFKSNCKQFIVNKS